MKTYLIGNFKSSRQTVDAQAFASNLDELYGLGFDHYKEYRALINAVTTNDIKGMANTYLKENQSVIVITKPSGASSDE